jgi:hypothetical protein
VNGFDGVLHWNGEELLDWYRSTREEVAPERARRTA